MVSFDQELLAQMELAASGGANHVNINSNELHFVIGISSGRMYFASHDRLEATGA